MTRKMKILRFLQLCLGYLFIGYIDVFINPRLRREGYPSCWFTKELERRGILKRKINLWKHY